MTDIGPHPDNSSQRQPFVWASTGIFVLALGIRLWHLAQLRVAPFFDLRLGDAKAYDSWARRIAAGDWWGEGVFYQAPLYPYFLGGVYATIGDDPMRVRIIQAILGAIACVLIAHAARRLFSNAAGIAAGLLLALYAPAIFFDAILGKSGLDLLLLCLSLWLLSGIIAEPRPARWIAVGATMGCLALTRENAVVFIAVILFWAITYFRRDKRRLLYCAAFVLGLAVILLPVAARNYAIGGEFHLTTSQFGPNFYIGNNERSDGSYVSLKFGRGHPDFESHDARLIAERDTGTEMTPAQVSRYWTWKSLQYIRDNFGSWLLLKAKTFFLLFNSLGVEDTEGQYTHARWSIPLRASGAFNHFGVIMPLAVAGVWVSWRQRRRLWLFYLLFGIYSLSVVMFYVFARYRLPLAPLAILLAAVGVVKLPRFIHQQPTTRVFACAAVVACVAVFCNWPHPWRHVVGAGMYNNVGAELRNRGQLIEAVAQFRQSLEIKDNAASVHHNLANTLVDLNQPVEAIDHYRRAVTLRPNSAEAYNEWGTALLNLARLDETVQMKTQRLEQAAWCFDRVVQIRPENAGMHLNLGLALHLLGRPEAAGPLRRAVELQPDLAERLRVIGIHIAPESRP